MPVYLVHYVANLHIAPIQSGGICVIRGDGLGGVPGKVFALGDTTMRVAARAGTAVAEVSTEFVSPATTFVSRPKWP